MCEGKNSLGARALAFDFEAKLHTHLVMQSYASVIFRRNIPHTLLFGARYLLTFFPKRPPQDSRLATCEKSLNLLHTPFSIPGSQNGNAFCASYRMFFD